MDAKQLPAVPPAGFKRYRVQLNAATPVQFPELLVDARHPGEAKEEFCRLNGISGSDCQWTIAEVKA